MYSTPASRAGALSGIYMAHFFGHDCAAVVRLEVVIRCTADEVEAVQLKQGILGADQTEGGTVCGGETGEETQYEEGVEEKHLGWLFDIVEMLV
jgi:hypothetical protein